MQSPQQPKMVQQPPSKNFFESNSISQANLSSHYAHKYHHVKSKTAQQKLRERKQPFKQQGVPAFQRDNYSVPVHGRKVVVGPKTQFFQMQHEHLQNLQNFNRRASANGTRNLEQSDSTDKPFHLQLVKGELSGQKWRKNLQKKPPLCLSQTDNPEPKLNTSTTTTIQKEKSTLQSIGSHNLPNPPLDPEPLDFPRVRHGSIQHNSEVKRIGQLAREQVLFS